ncbi:hypothetical protein BUALT_Bualt05G0169000 [Buddleja alternifolia]|uniref:Uncharacterized protein n=1 Tax=Buddleja alternifolia TaxID=168488 RepID=A0AAV6XVX7_9LAMI|nr:hypothetical protein BUALT_Bualt05G0169000 [Buddleja alternifolia]
MVDQVWDCGGDREEAYMTDFRPSLSSHASIGISKGVGRVLKLVDKEIRDLLLEYGSTQPDIHIGRLDYVVELIQEHNENPIGFLGLPKVAFQISVSNTSRFKVFHV